MTNKPSWSIYGDVATWVYSFDPPEQRLLSDAPFRGRWLADCVEKIANALGSFATIQEIMMSSDSLGEPAYSATKFDAQKSHTFIEATPDLWTIEILLLLHVELPGNAPEYIDIRAARMTIFIEVDKFGHIDDATKEIVWGSLTLTTNIHVPMTREPEPNNVICAALNGPTLSAFLHRLESETQAEFLYAESLSYSDQVSRYGFDSGDAPT